MSTIERIAINIHCTHLLYFCPHSLKLPFWIIILNVKSVDSNQIALVRNLKSELVYFPQLIHTFSYNRAMDHSRKETVVPPSIPDKIKYLIFAFWESKALFAARELGIFDLLHNSKTPQSGKDIAAKMKADVDTTAHLMELSIILHLSANIV